TAGLQAKTSAVPLVNRVGRSRVVRTASRTDGGSWSSGTCWADRTLSHFSAPGTGVNGVCAFAVLAPAANTPATSPSQVHRNRRSCIHHLTGTHGRRVVFLPS